MSRVWRAHGLSHGHTDIPRKIRTADHRLFEHFDGSLFRELSTSKCTYMHWDELEFPVFEVTDVSPEVVSVSAEEALAGVWMSGQFSDVDMINDIADWLLKTQLPVLHVSFAAAVADRIRFLLENDEETHLLLGRSEL
jgi:hypothetical protein